MNEHWTQDTELLERYVLGKISGEQQRLLEGHLQTCHECRRAVNAERLLVAGIKRFGRERMKATLQSRLSRRIPVPWQTIMSTAAVLIVAVGIALSVFELKEDAPIQEEQAIGEARPPDEVPFPADTRAEERRESRDRAGSRDRAALQRRTPSPRMALRDESASPAAGAVTRPRVDLLMEDVDDKGSSYWVDGILTEEVAEKARRVGEKDVMLERALPQTRRTPGEPVQTEWEQTIVQGEDTINVVTIFKPQASLSSVQQQKLIETKNTVPALVRHQPRQITVTIFMDTKHGLAGSLLIHLPKSDSLVIQLDGQKIEYKLKAF